MVNRAKLRGKPLDEDCKTARTTTHEYGPVDDRVFCRGLFDRRNDVPIEKCYGCKAFVENATPIWEESAADKEKASERYIKLPQPKFLPLPAEELEAFATKLYQSPIEIIMQEMQTQFEGEVFKATQAYGINVDKNELIKALEYDRDQYNKGFADGSRIDTTAIRAEVAREIFEEIESEIVAALQSNYRAKQERVEKQLPDDFVSYMCEGKIAALRGIGAFVEELKNKYAEGKK